MKKIIELMLIALLATNLCAYAEGEIFTMGIEEVNYLSGAVEMGTEQSLFAPSVNANNVAMYDEDGNAVSLINASYENNKVIIVPQFALESAKTYSVVFSSDVLLENKTPIAQQTVTFSTSMKSFDIKNVEFTAAGGSLQLTVKAQNLNESDAQAVLAVTMLNSSGMIEKCSLFPISVTASDSDWEESFSVTPAENIQTVCAVVINNQAADNVSKISSSYKWTKE